MRMATHQMRSAALRHTDKFTSHIDIQQMSKLAEELWRENDIQEETENVTGYFIYFDGGRAWFVCPSPVMINYLILTTDIRQILRAIVFLVRRAY